MQVMDWLRSAQVGDFIIFEEESREYEVLARSQSSLVCAKLYLGQRTIIYTIIDLDSRSRSYDRLDKCPQAGAAWQCEKILAAHKTLSKSDLPLRVKSMRSAGGAP